MAENIKVVQWGLGAMGSGMVKLLAERKGIEVVGAIDTDPAKVGKPLCSVTDRNSAGVMISDDPKKVLNETKPNLVLLATGSFVKQVYPQIEEAISAGCNLISIAEEMAAPEEADAKLARKIDELALKYGVTVVGTGVNPGFVLDALIIALSGVCPEVKKIEAERINDLSPFGKTVMETQGVGTTPEEFSKGISSGAIVGHIGFPQSISIIARALGWKLEKIEEDKKPIISKTNRETPWVKVKPGMVAGCNHQAIGYADGKPVVVLKHPQQVRPEAEGIETGDFITLHSRDLPPVKMAITPEIPGGVGTIAMAVNMIPIVLKSEPGLKSLVELPFPTAWKSLKEV